MCVLKCRVSSPGWCMQPCAVPPLPPHRPITLIPLIFYSSNPDIPSWSYTAQGNELWCVKLTESSDRESSQYASIRVQQTALALKRSSHTLSEVLRPWFLMRSLCRAEESRSSEGAKRCTLPELNASSECNSNAGGWYYGPR